MRRVIHATLLWRGAILESTMARDGVVSLGAPPHQTLSAPEGLEGRVLVEGGWLRAPPQASRAWLSFEDGRAALHDLRARSGEEISLEGVRRGVIEIGEVMIEFDRASALSRIPQRRPLSGLVDRGLTKALLFALILHFIFLGIACIYPRVDLLPEDSIECFRCMRQEACLMLHVNNGNTEIYWSEIDSDYRGSYGVFLSSIDSHSPYGYKSELELIYKSDSSDNIMNMFFDFSPSRRRVNDSILEIRPTGISCRINHRGAMQCL